MQLFWERRAAYLIDSEGYDLELALCEDGHVVGILDYLECRVSPMTVSAAREQWVVIVIYALQRVNLLDERNEPSERDGPWLRRQLFEPEFKCACRCPNDSRATVGRENEFDVFQESVPAVAEVLQGLG